MDDHTFNVVVILGIGIALIFVGFMIGQDSCDRDNGFLPSWLGDIPEGWECSGNTAQGFKCKPVNQMAVGGG